MYQQIYFYILFIEVIKKKETHLFPNTGTISLRGPSEFFCLVLVLHLVWRWGFRQMCSISKAWNGVFLRFTVISQQCLKLTFQNPILMSSFNVPGILAQCVLFRSIIIISMLLFVILSQVFPLRSFVDYMLGLQIKVSSFVFARCPW